MPMLQRSRSLVFAALMSILPISMAEAPAEPPIRPTVDQILERHLEAVGGLAAVERCTTRVMTGRIITDLPTWKPPVYEEALVEIRSSTSDGFIMTQQGPDGMRWDGFDGAVRWSANGRDIELHDGPDAHFAWLVDPQNAARFREYFPDMRFRGEMELGGRLVYVIDVDDHPSHALCFDAGTGLLVRLGYNGELSAYRSVDGVKVAFRYTLSRKGGSSTYIFDSIAHNVPIDRRQFAVPGSAH